MRRPKFFNKVTNFHGHRFDSIKEANRYKELEFLLKAGVIKNLKLQERFELQPGYRLGEKAIRKIEYVSDFSYEDVSGKKIVEDVKSDFTRRNPVYTLKKKILLFKHQGFEFREIN